jgi:hypothetical protein
MKVNHKGTSSNRATPARYEADKPARRVRATSRVKP